MQIRARILAVAVIAAVVVGGWACSDSTVNASRDAGHDVAGDGEPDAANDATGPAALRIEEPADPMLVGDEAPLRAELLDEQGGVLGQADEVDWSVDDEQIISLDVDQERMRAEGPGTTEVRAEHGELSDELEVDVELEPSIEFVQHELIMAQSSSTYAEVEAFDENGDAVEDPNATWESKDEDVVRVTEYSGQVRAINQGEAEVCVVWRGDDDCMDVSVRDVNSIEIRPDERELVAGDQLQLEVQYRDQHGVEIESDDEPIWSSSNDEVARVDDDGLVEALSGGKTRISVESEGEYDESHFYVDVRFEQISCAQDFCCAVSHGGDVYCWGDNQQGALGVGDSSRRDLPTRVDVDPDDVSFEQVSTDVNGACALDEEGDPWCWGLESRGRLGSDLSDTEAVTSPERIDTEAHFDEIQLQHFGTYAIDDNDELYAWGTWPPSGAENAPAHDRPTKVDDGAWAAFSDFSDRSLCVYDVGGTPYCIGENDGYEFGQGQDGEEPWEELTPWGDRTDIEVVTGETGAGGCGLDGDGKVWCAANTNEMAYLGHPVESSQCRGDVPPTHDTPKRTDWDDEFETLHSQEMQVCGIRDEQLWCWGRNTQCQLARDPQDDSVPECSHRDEPVLIETHPPEDVGLMDAAGCILAQEGRLYCWGRSEGSHRGPWSDHFNNAQCDPEVVRIYPYQR